MQGLTKTHVVNSILGNAITQSFMTIPALVASFPRPGSADYATRAMLLGRQWPYCWAVGNVFFRPISTLSTVGYAYLAYRTMSAPRSSSREGEAPARGRDWRFFAAAAVLGVVTIVHSAVNMQPLNDRLAALAETSTGADAVELVTTWARWNMVRIVAPLVGGTAALSQVLA